MSTAVTPPAARLLIGAVVGVPRRCGMRVRSFHPIAPDVHSKGAHWSEDALCRGIPEVFFAPVKTRRSDPPDWSRAKRICEGCPVKDKCLADGLKADKLGAYGIWGGLDPDERGRLGVGS